MGHGVSPDVIDPFGVHPVQNGVAIQLQTGPQHVQQLQADVTLQVEAVKELSEAMAAAMRMRPLLHSRQLQTRWEGRQNGAALVFTGSSELQQPAAKLGNFAEYLDGKGDDLRAARRRTAAHMQRGGWRKPEQRGNTGAEKHRPGKRQPMSPRKRGPKR
jgi:hypothetical protein